MFKYVFERLVNGGCLHWSESGPHRQLYHRPHLRSYARYGDERQTDRWRGQYHQILRSRACYVTRNHWSRAVLPFSVAEQANSNGEAQVLDEEDVRGTGEDPDIGEAESGLEEDIGEGDLIRVDHILH